MGGMWLAEPPQNLPQLSRGGHTLLQTSPSQWMGKAGVRSLGHFHPLQDLLGGTLGSEAPPLIWQRHCGICVTWQLQQPNPALSLSLSPMLFPNKKFASTLNSPHPLPGEPNWFHPYFARFCEDCIMTKYPKPSVRWHHLMFNKWQLWCQECLIVSSLITACWDFRSDESLEDHTSQICLSRG